MMALDPIASRSPDGTGVCCPGQGAPSPREMTIGQDIHSSNQLDEGRIASYRAGLGEHCGANAPRAIVVGNPEEPSGESRVSNQEGSSGKSLEECCTVPRPLTGAARAEPR